MKVLLVTWCLAVTWCGVMGRTRECICGYGNLCLDDLPSDFSCHLLEEHGKEISRDFYSPTDFDTPINHCRESKESPCERGNCVPTFGSYFCDCPADWYGQNCNIHDPTLKSEEVKNPVYVYYQVQTGKKGERLPFYLIYDPGLQSRIAKPNETGVRVDIEMSEGRHYHPLRRYNFLQLNVKEICLSDARAEPDLYDIRVCDYVPEGVHWVYQFNPKSYSRYLRERRLLYPGGTDEQDLAGNLVERNINIRFMKDGKEKYILFRRSYQTFTYFISKVPNLCLKEIKFDGCSDYSYSPSIYLRGNPIKIKTVTLHLPNSCEGSRNMETKWYLQRDVGYDGEYDSEPEELDFGDSKAITFPPRFFTDGIHTIQVRRALKGDPPHYGGTSINYIYGVCFISVELGPMILEAKGGNMVASSCYVHLEIDLISHNPSMNLVDMEFTISCRKTKPPGDTEPDHECRKRKTEVPKIRKIVTPCDTEYEYNITATHFISKPQSTELQITVRFVRKNVRLVLSCLFNCYPIDPEFRTTVVASTIPYVPASIVWTVKVDGEVLEKDEFLSPIRSFQPLSSTRILRLSGEDLYKKNATLTDVSIAASIKGAEELTAILNLKTNNLRFELDKFYTVNSNEGYLFFRLLKSSEVHFEYAPVEYRIVAINEITNDSLTFATIYYTLLIRDITPEFYNVRLCVYDSMQTRACSERHKLERLNHADIRGETLEFYAAVGYDRKLLYDSAILMKRYLKPIIVEDRMMYSWNGAESLRLNVMLFIMQLEVLVELEVQTIIHILTMTLFSREGNMLEGFSEFEGNFDLKHLSEISKKEFWNWMLIRKSALEVLEKITIWVQEIWEERLKLINHEYGDVLDGVARCLNLAHTQDTYVKRTSDKLETIEGHNEVLNAHLHIASMRNDQILKRTYGIFVAAAARYSRLYYGIRDIGIKGTRIWMTRNTYQGILDAFNKSHTGETQLGYSNYIFGPVHKEEVWLQHAQLRLPELERVITLKGKEMIIVVGIVGNRYYDSTISPTLIIYFTGKESGPYTQLPGGIDYGITLPKLIRGKDPNPKYGDYVEIPLIKPSNESLKYKYFLVVKVKLPNEFDEWQLQLRTVLPYSIKVKETFTSPPDYDDVLNTKPLIPRDKEGSSYKEVDYVVKPDPHSSHNTRTVSQFYIGLLLGEDAPADTRILLRVRPSVDICWIQDLDTEEDETTCKGKPSAEFKTIECVCNQFGFITARSTPVRVTQVMMTRIELVVDASISPVQLSLPIIWAVFIIALVILAIFLDRRRKKKVPNTNMFTKTVLILMGDTRPLDTYPMVIGVFTSPNLMAGSISTVAIKLEGRSSSSRVHLLKCKSRSTLKRATDDWFVLLTNQPLGKIKHIFLWHDFHCLSNWYCDYVLIYDIKQDNWYLASVKRWFRLHPTVDESRFACIKTYKFGNVENGLKAMPGKLKYHLIYETNNTHYLISLFTLHIRSLYSLETRTLAFLIKLSAIFVGTWMVQTLHLFHNEHEQDMAEPTLQDIHIDEDSFWIVLIIDAISYLILMPYVLLVGTTSQSGLIQKKTTNPQNVDVIRKEQVTIGAEKKGKRKEQIQPQDKPTRSVLFQVDSEDRTESAQSWIVKKPDEDQPPRAPKQWTAKHFQHSRKSET